MSNSDNYESQYPHFTSIAEKDLKPHSMPVDVYLQEAENLYRWAKEDEAELLGVGLDATLL